MSKRAPGPRNRILTTQRVLAKPFEWFPKWRERYGDPYRLPTMNGSVTMTGRPELIKEIFKASPDGYEPWAAQTVVPFVGPNSLLATTGAPHKRDRKLLMPPFHGERMRSLSEVMALAARNACREVLAKDGGRVEALDLGQEISLEIIIRAVFGVSEASRVETYKAAIKDFMRTAHPGLLFFKALHANWFGPWRRYRKAYDAFDALLQQEVEAARESGEGRDDILGLLISARYEDGSPMDDAVVRDQCRTMLIAGHETAAVSLAWCLDELGRDPELLARVRSELDEATARSAEPEAAFAESKWLDGLWKETLRLHPVVTEALRLVNRPMNLGGFDVPVGEGVSVSILHVHMDPDLYPEPERFRPERFFDRKLSPTEYLPFGGGHRRCIGAAFAAHEMQIVLGVLLAEYEFELSSPQRAQPVRRNVTLAPNDGVPLRLRVRGRESAAAAE